MAFGFSFHGTSLFSKKQADPAHVEEAQQARAEGLAHGFLPQGEAERDCSRNRLSRYCAAPNKAFTRLVKRDTLREAFFLWMEPFTAVFSITGIAAFSASWA